jgi:hypothetical protein
VEIASETADSREWTPREFKDEQEQFLAAGLCGPVEVDPQPPPAGTVVLHRGPGPRFPGRSVPVFMVVNHTARWWIGVPMGWPRYHLVYVTLTLAAPLFLFLVGFYLPLSRLKSPRLEPARYARNCWAAFSMVPQLGAGGWTPRPRNERTASAMMAVGIETVA